MAEIVPSLEDDQSVDHSDGGAPRHDRWADLGCRFGRIRRGHGRKVVERRASAAASVLRRPHGDVMDGEGCV